MDERIGIVQEIWDSIASDTAADIPITPEQREELQRRMVEHERNPQAAVPWSEVRRELMNRFGGEHPPDSSR